MVTTVTTTTTAILTTVTAGTLTLIVVLTLISLLVKKEIIGSLTGERSQRLARVLNAAILPLFVVFVATVAARVADVLR
jgi:hypothetical protein